MTFFWMHQRIDKKISVKTFGVRAEPETSGPKQTRKQREVGSNIQQTTWHNHRCEHLRYYTQYTLANPVIQS